MYDIEDIPLIPDQQERLQEVTVDCYGQSEELSAMEVYLMDAIIIARCPAASKIGRGIGDKYKNISLRWNRRYLTNDTPKPS